MAFLPLVTDQYREKFEKAMTNIGAAIENTKSQLKILEEQRQSDYTAEGLQSGEVSSRVEEDTESSSLRMG